MDFLVSHLMNILLCCRHLDKNSPCSIECLPDEVLCKILNSFNTLDLQQLGPVNRRFTACRMEVLKKRGFTVLQPGYSTNSIPTLKTAIRLQRAVALLESDNSSFSENILTIFLNLLSRRKQCDSKDKFGHRMSRVFERINIPKINITDFNSSSGVLQLPKDILADQNPSLAYGVDKFSRKFFALYVRDKKEKEKVSLITVQQRYTKLGFDHIWAISQNASLFHDDRNRIRMTEEDVKKIATILMGAHPQYELANKPIS